MALATRCPNCQALFRVVADQLKLRGGLVRCGACRHVFDAIGSLAYVDDTSNVSAAAPAEQKTQRMAGSMASLLTPSPAPAAAPAPPTRATEATPDVTPPASGDSSLDDFAPAPRIGAPPPAQTPETSWDDPRTGAPEAADQGGQAAADPMFGDAPRLGPDAGDAMFGDVARRPPDRQRPRRRRAESKGDGEPEENPLAVPTLLAAHADATVDLNALRAERDGTDETTPQDDDEDEARRRRRRERRARRVAEHEAQAAAVADEEVDHDSPEFLREERSQRGFSVVFGGGSVVLALLLVLQAAVLFRTEIVTRWPSLRPTIVQVCALAGCTVTWPTRAELLAVVGTELQAIPGTDVLELRTVIRNRAPFKVALPAIEVALTDTQNRTIARKVFAPVDYLASSGEPAARIEEGLGAGSDYEVRIAFEARGLNAVGFVVYPFYL